MGKFHQLFNCMNCHKRMRAMGTQTRRNFCSQQCEQAYQVHRQNMFVIHGDENHKEKKAKALQNNLRKGRRGYGLPKMPNLPKMPTLSSFLWRKGRR